MKTSTAPLARTSRLLPALLAALVVITLAGCGGGEDVAAVARDKGLLAPSIVGNGVQFADSQSWSPGYLFGEAFTVSRPETIVRFGLFASIASGDSARIALYADQAGVPYALVDSSSEFLVLAGNNQSPAQAHSTIGAGTYWIMALLGPTTGADISSDNTGIAGAYYLPLAWGSALPATLASPVAYPHVPLNLYMEVSP